MKLFFYQAECGDATRIQYTGTDKQQHHIFIDAGFERTYQQVLQGDIRALALSKTGIDLFVISHIHDDHAGGALAYIKAIKNGTIKDVVNQWAYNPPRGRVNKTGRLGDGISDAKSISQGDRIAEYLAAKNKLPLADITNDQGCLDIFGLRVTFLSPDKQSLQNLRTKYAPAKRIPFEHEELPDISIAKSTKRNDYATPLKDFNLIHADEDTSVENRSSIAVLAEYQNKRFLSLADAHSSVVSNSLQRMGYSKKNPIVCDWVKIAHHGSKGNNLSILYDLIRCDNYVISANGENKYQLPSKQCLATIIRGAQRTSSICNLYFTYDTRALRNIFNADGNDIFSELNFAAHFSKRLFLSFES